MLLYDIVMILNGYVRDKGRKKERKARTDAMRLRAVV